MGISKFVVGVLTLAIGLFVVGMLGAETLRMLNLAKRGTMDHSGFKLGEWNRKLTQRSNK